jgi:primary-amine oxidase
VLPRPTSPLPALLLGLGLLATAPAAASAAPGDNCAPGRFLDQTLPQGGRWQMCWEVRAEEGPVFFDVYYTAPGAVARLVLREAALSQIHVSYDDGAAPQDLVTYPGLGGARLRALVADDCQGGTLLADAGKNVLCRWVDDVGYLYKYYGVQKQSYALRVASISRIGDLAYVVQWRFLDAGGIEPAVRLTGRIPRLGSDDRFGFPLDAAGTVGVGQVHSYVFKLAFDLADNGDNDVLEELEFVPASSNSRRNRQATALTSEGGRSLDPGLMRSWRIRDDDVTNSDAHDISYHLDPLDADYRYDGGAGEPWSAHDLWATRTKACERFAVGNPTDTGCAADVSGFADGESILRQRITLWYVVSAYRLPRSEDQPFVNTHWDGFRVTPRDWTAVSGF